RALGGGDPRRAGAVRRVRRLVVVPAVSVLLAPRRQLRRRGDVPCRAVRERRAVLRLVRGARAAVAGGAVGRAVPARRLARPLAMAAAAARRRRASALGG